MAIIDTYRVDELARKRYVRCDAYQGAFYACEWPR